MLIPYPIVCSPCGPSDRALTLVRAQTQHLDVGLVCQATIRLVNVIRWTLYRGREPVSPDDSGVELSRVQVHGREGG